MAYVIVKPTDTTDPDYQTELDTYNRQIEGIRRLASPDLITRFTETDLPESLIADDVYLLAAEREVLREAAIAVSDIAGLSVSDAMALLLLVQIKLTLEFISQLPQLLQEGILGETQRFAEIDWEDRETRLLSKYRNELLAINPAADVVDDSQIVVVGETTASQEIDFDVPYYNRTELYGRNP